MATIWIPMQEGSLLRALQDLFDTTFYQTLESIPIQFRTHTQASVIIQYSESDQVAFDVLVDNDFRIQSGQIASSARIYQIQYVSDLVGVNDLFTGSRCCDTAYINRDPLEKNQVSELWREGIGNAKSLFARTNQYESIDPIYHFAWLTLLLAYQFSFDDALVVARAAMNVPRETWPDDIQFFPAATQLSTKQSEPFKSINPNLFSLYPVVPTYDLIHSLVKDCHVFTAQLRIKDRNEKALEKQIELVSELSKQTGAQLFINDHWECAIKYKVFGIHLGQEDLENADLDLIRLAGLRLGISTHGYYEILVAESIQPSYIALGHIFPTTTKEMPSNPQGLVRLALYQALINSLTSSGTSVPTVAIGGINLENAERVLKTGVSSIAVVRAITQAKNIAQAVSGFKQLIETIRVRDEGAECIS